MGTLSDDERFIAELLRALEKTGLEAIVVGMAAAALQGAPVTTQDVDLLVRDTPLNRDKVRMLAKELGAAVTRPSPLTSTLTLAGGDTPVDVLFEEIAGSLRFESIRSRASHVAVGKRAAVVASLEDIIASKEAAGRPKDAAQLPILRATLQVKLALDK